MVCPTGDDDICECGSYLEVGNNYFECERVHHWHIVVGYIFFVFTVIVSIVTILTAVVVWKYRYLTLVRFRSPKSIVAFSIFANIYHISRLIYAAILLKWIAFDTGLDTAIYCIRAIGTNGALLTYVVRAWMFYVTYQYDKDIIDEERKTKSCIVQYKSVRNDEFVLKVAGVYLVILSTILTITRTLQLWDDFALVFNTLTFLLLVAILIRMPKSHDQLGIVREYLIFFTVALLGMIVYLVIQMNTDFTTKRVFSWVGLTILNLVGITLTFYIPFIHYNQLKIIRGDTGASSYEYNVHKLARVLISARGYELYRQYLETIYCPENLDFFVLVQQYKQSFHKQESRSNNLRRATATAHVHRVGHTTLKKAHDSSQSEGDALSGSVEKIHRSSHRAETSPVVSSQPNSASSRDQKPSVVHLSSDKDGRHSDKKNDPDGAPKTGSLRIELTSSDSRAKVLDPKILNKIISPVSFLMNTIGSSDHLRHDPLESLKVDKGKKLDINRLTFDYVKIPDEVANGDHKVWAEWMYHKYVDNHGEQALNTSQQKRDVIKHKLFPHEHKKSFSFKSAMLRRISLNRDLEASQELSGSRLAELASQPPSELATVTVDTMVHQTELARADSVKRIEARDAASGGPDGDLSDSDDQKEEKNAGAAAAISPKSATSPRGMPSILGVVNQVVDLVSIFDELQKEAWELMVKDSFMHFQRSKHYDQFQEFESNSMPKPTDKQQHAEPGQYRTKSNLPKPLTPLQRKQQEAIDERMANMTLGNANSNSKGSAIALTASIGDSSTAASSTAASSSGPQIVSQDTHSAQ